MTRLRRLPAPGDWLRFGVDRAGVMLGTIEKRGPVTDWWVVVAADGEVLPRARSQSQAVATLTAYADGRADIVNDGEHVHRD